MTAHERITVSRCQDPALIEFVLARDYFDYPICLFSKSLLRAASRWMAKSEDVYFIVAESAGKQAGFVFANTLGKRLWRSFALRHPHLIPQLTWTLARMRLFGKAAYPHDRFAHARPRSEMEKVATLDLPQTDAPFRWSDADSHTGYVELLSVSSAFRGRQVASLMLRVLVEQMRSREVSRIEAHIDPGNYASARAFLNAGWAVEKTATDDYLTYIRCNSECEHKQPSEADRLLESR